MVFIPSGCLYSSTVTGPSRTAWKPILVAVLAVLIAGGIGYYAWTLRATRADTLEQLEAARVEAASGAAERQRNEQLNQEIATCKTEREAESKRCQRAETAVASMQSDLAATRDELDHLRKQREETAKRLEAFKELTGKFQQMIDAGRLDVGVRNGQMVVKLPAGVLFESGSADLSRDGELALMEVAVVLRDIKDRKFMVVGHTDNRPLESAKTSRFRNNWELSTARAVRVVEFLIEAHIDPAHLIAAGNGEFDPVGDNKTAKGQQQNRRIEIVLLPNIEELPALPQDQLEAEPKPE